MCRGTLPKAVRHCEITFSLATSTLASVTLVLVAPAAILAGIFYLVRVIRARAVFLSFRLVIVVLAQSFYTYRSPM